MTVKIPSFSAARLRKSAFAPAMASLVLLLAGCAAPPASGINDPWEATNRTIHKGHKRSDTWVIKPASKVYGAVVPAPLRQGVSNVADTLDLPGDMANDVLQGDAEGLTVNTLRLGVNLTLGVLGLFDAASAIGLPEAKTDFGETLHVWGVAEGPYVELPVFGPSTARDAVGTVVDLALNPMGQVFSGNDAVAATATKVLSKLGDRYRYSDTVDSILYDSADSYAQARLLYLQNRRFELGQTGAADADGGAGFIDPYEDPYGQ